MPSLPSRPAPHPNRSTVVLVVAALTLLSGLALPGLVPASAAVPTPPAAEATPAAVVPAPASPAPQSSPSALANYHLTPDIAAQSPSRVFCSFSSSPGSVSRYCFPQAQNPSALHLANGNIAVAYSILTNDTTSTCAVPANLTNSRIGFSVSTDGGLSFGNITYLGNDTCPYVNAIEPSFAVSNAGPIYGAFVEENFSNASNAEDPGLPPDYGNRTGDALGFVTSTDNGTTFSTVRTVVTGGNIARPAVAAIGETVYVTYTDTANGTTPMGQGTGITRPSPLPEDVRMVVSTDGGQTWGTPIILPGENSSSQYTAFGASIAVSHSGTVAVAYATDRSCLSSFGPCATAFSSVYGENVVVVSSDSNGSTWRGPVTVGGPAAEAGCYGYDNGTPASSFYTDPCLQYLFELTPQTSVTFGATNQTLYVAYSGGHPDYYYYYENSNVSVSVSTNGGKSWTATTIEDPALNNMFTQEEYSTPALGYSNGTVYLSYLEKNGTSCDNLEPLFSIYCSLLLGSYIEWVTSSHNGLTWTTPYFVAIQTSAEYTPRWIQSFSGYTDSVTFNSAGQPVFAFAIDQRPDSAAGSIGGTNYQTIDFGTLLDVAVGGAGSTVDLTFQIQGNPGTVPWSFSVNGQNFTGAAGTTTYVVTGVPANQTVKIEGPTAIPNGFWKERVFRASVPELSQFAANATVDFNGTADLGISFSYQPPNLLDWCLCLYLDGAYYIYIPYVGAGFGGISEPAFPWYFPAGTKLLVQPQLNSGSDPTLYYTGTGNGSYTGPGTWANLTMNAPINETVWNGLIGNGSINVNAVGLPSGTPYSFQVDGVSATGVAGTTTYVANLPVGPHVVTGAQANGTGGFEWFGSPASTTVVVPFESNVTLDFASVNLSSALGTVAFQASGLTAGSEWTISFNGTLYSTTGGTINVTSRSGIYPFASYSAVALGGTAGYAPTTVGPSASVQSGSTFLVNYTSAYLVRIAPGVGGTDSSPLTGWSAPGTVLPLSATPSSGYTFVEWAGTGNGSYSGPLASTNVTVQGPIEETAVFAALPGARFNLTFTEAGVPSGSFWSVNLDGRNYAAATSGLQVSNLYPCSVGAKGLYTLSLPYATDATQSGIRYVPNSLNGTVCTTGSTVVPVQYSTEYLVNTTTNLPAATVSATCGLSVGTAVWCSAGAPTDLAAPAVAGYSFLGWIGTGAGSYTGNLSNANFDANGPVSELANYAPAAPPPTYTVTFSASPAFLVGTTWSVSLGGHAYSSSGSTLLVPGVPAGTAQFTLSTAYSPTATTKYTPLLLTVGVAVSGNTAKTVRYGVDFAGTISGSSGGTVGPAGGWFAANASVPLSAVPNAGQQFVSWTGTGGAYSGTDPNGSFSVTAPFTEIATFAPVGSVPSTTSTTSSPWNSPPLWAGLAVVGLLVGLAVGLLLLRRGRPPAGEEPASSAAEPTPEESASPPADDPPAPEVA
ncbi:MAG: hypothetical protein L3K00_03005 [Thermoplasmata archaeon]|nr:hypothetical protein [Thermoplasmata archaeon]